MPESDEGDVIADGTHCPVRRPSEKTLRCMVYSGKKKCFAYNTAVHTNTDRVIIEMSKSPVGSTGDITLFREDPMSSGKWTSPYATPPHQKQTGSASGYLKLKLNLIMHRIYCILYKK